MDEIVFAANVHRHTNKKILTLVYLSLTVWYLFFSAATSVKRGIKKSCSYSVMAAIRATTLTATNPR